MPLKKTTTVTERPSISLSNVIAIVVVIVIIVAIGFGVDKYTKARTKGAQPAVAAAQTVAYDCAEGKTALDVLKTTAKTNVQDSSLGAYVESINDTANSENQFWIFYVNGQIGTVGSDQYTCKDGDKIEWRYEKLF